MRRSRSVLMCPAVLVLVAGCGGGDLPKPEPLVTPIKAAGTVKYKGQTLGGGTIKIVPEGDEAQAAYCNIDINGRYAVENVPTGKVLIKIETQSAMSYDPRYGGPSGKPLPPDVKLPPGAKPPEPKRYVPMPPKTVEHTFAEGDNVFNIDIP